MHQAAETTPTNLKCYDVIYKISRDFSVVDFVFIYDQFSI